MAGQGNVLCAPVVDHFKQIVNGTIDKTRIGFCLDTAHLFGAGYDIKHPKVIDQLLQHFDEEIGLGYLKAFHLNDSKVACSSRKDRHELLGEGLIGWEPFKYLLRHPLLSSRHDIIWVTETTDDANVQRTEIAQLFQFVEKS
jgi:apurinic endonuclease APN1